VFEIGIVTVEDIFLFLFDEYEEAVFGFEKKRANASMIKSIAP
jgi:hypothetical protein